MMKSDVTVYASSNSIDVIGKLYEFVEKDEYEYSNNKNFVSTNAGDTFGVLELFDMKTKSSDIIHREEYWKQVFQTVQFGMNNVGNSK